MNSIKNQLDLTGKVALVTGASSGIGRHFAKVLAVNGASVIAAARSYEKLEELAREIQSNGDNALPFRLDVSSTDDVRAAYDYAEQEFGTVDIIVNSAAFMDYKPVMDVDENSWNKIIDVNLTGIWRIASEGGCRLIKSGKSGSIINISSPSAYLVTERSTAMSTSKAAVAHLTRHLALELAPNGIRVNAILPGIFMTGMGKDFLESEGGQEYVSNRLPTRRIGELHELDIPLLLLASDAGSYMTGTMLLADGGLSLSPP